ncbi:DUF262 domain-containing protein [Pontibacter akesuensis]|uniref:GmrSD restriction endonucleases N-terminal domain-containing protein n=1 Tax=Pontibacter akesuensis TaxID=388950 RepID=A0A1I7JY33_9BACT|nr:DUF262 domain-containing protein [Pontibacter akesuensis]GHA76650.1 hypothetical protein GCM10007389_33300 [Pontibacter akesuensis]SFU90069.1 hypothetical protein SAMN04487941_3172 [Pontibacter akesuensis]
MRADKLPSSSAQDRSISVWFQKIENSEIKLPRFQRHQAWDKNKITSLLNTVIHNLPLGVTLILEVGSTEPFVSRYLATAPEKTGSRVTEHLLDGQQRLTALWRALHNNYEWEKYFLYVSDLDSSREKPEERVVTVHCQGRWNKKDGQKMPLWADSAVDTLHRGLLPIDLFMPGDKASYYENWVTEALKFAKPKAAEEDYEEKLEGWMEKKNAIISLIRDVRETIAHYNLPYLALLSSTTKDTALQVFINMNTNSKPLSQYDIIRAEIESVKGESLDDLEKALKAKYPRITHYFDIPFLVLATSSLIQDRLPNNRGMWDMDKGVMVENWDKMTTGLAQMASFMEQEGIYDRARLPTNAVLAVIAALYVQAPQCLDAHGNTHVLLKKYMWSGFFTDRYENAAASSAFTDYMALKKIVNGVTKEDGTLFTEADVPIFNKTHHPISTPEELIRIGWPKRENIRARAIMAVFSKLGAYDFADGTKLTRDQLLEGKRHYHHVFPDNLLQEAGMENSYIALNCALITDKTNLNISNKEPLKYLKERYAWTDEDIVQNRLKSHLIPIDELANGGYEGLSEEQKKEKVMLDYTRFIEKRAKLVYEAALQLTNGRDIVPSDIYKAVEKQPVDNEAEEALV